MQKGILNAAKDSKKIIIVCMTFKKSLKLKKNSFFHFFSLLKFSSEMPSCPTLWYDAQ
ncbi:hypothetical protein EH11_02996 [Bacillus subtilis]|nr:hypothetical protein EH11_02996 [Bacillus subtilis]RUS06891.1 hypothetical protein EFW59_03005 [Bacillus subtilis]